MKKMHMLLIAAVAFSIVPATLAVPISVIVDDAPEQDILFGGTHELGIGFPADELIGAIQVLWQGHIPCPVDYMGGSLVQVQITNLSINDWEGLVYVADPETTLSNNDGSIADTLAPTIFTDAFVIDAVGANTPLVFESMIQDNIFQAGETWEFVIQEYNNVLGLNPGLLDSWDQVSRGMVAGASVGGPPSSGSIIAIPEPATAMLLLVAMGVLGAVRRHTRR